MKRILITRSPHQASELADALRARGAHPILIPTISLTTPTTFAPLDAALANLAHYHWLLFTSANAVQSFHDRLQTFATNQPDLASGPIPNQVPQGFSLGSHSLEEDRALAPGVCLPPGLRIASIGPATTKALQAVGFQTHLVPPQAIAESLTESLFPHALQPPDATGQATPTRFLLVRAEQARDLLPDTLRAAGAQVTLAPAYRNVVPESSIAALKTLFASPETYPDAITFTSSSTATNLFTLLESAHLTLPPTILRASIGPITSATLRDLGYPPQLEAAEPTVPALVEILVKSLYLK